MGSTPVAQKDTITFIPLQKVVCCSRLKKTTIRTDTGVTMKVQWCCVDFQPDFQSEDQMVGGSRLVWSLHCCVVSLDKKTLLHIIFIQPGVLMATDDILLGDNPEMD